MRHSDLDNRDEQNPFFVSGNNPQGNNLHVHDEEPIFKINELSHRINILEKKVDKIENYLHQLSSYQNRINKR